MKGVSRVTSVEPYELDAAARLALESTRIEDQCVALIVSILPMSERHNLVARLAHRFGWETTETDLYQAARELGIDLDAPARDLAERIERGEV